MPSRPRERLAGRWSHGVLVAITIGLVALSAPPASAAAGALDPTYDGDGITTNRFGTGGHVVVDAQDRAVVGGKVMAGRVDAGQPSIMRYSPTGALDPTLDDDGRMSLPVQGSVRGLALQRGNIVVATRYALWRLLPDGTPDPSFGGDGRIDLPPGYSVGGFHPLGATRQRVFVLAAKQGSHASFVFAFLADGSRRRASTPSSFERPGLQAVALHQGFLYAVGVHPDDASAPDGSPDRVMVVRFGTSPLSFDASYNGGTGRSFGTAIRYDEYGYVTSYAPRDIAINPATGKLYVVGEEYECSTGDCSSYYHGFAMRLLVAGGVDAAFGVDGVTRAVCSNVDGAYAVALQGGKTLAGGTSRDKYGDDQHHFSLSAVSGFAAFRSQACYPPDSMTPGAAIADLAFTGMKVIAVGGRYTARYLTS